MVRLLCLLPALGCLQSVCAFLLPSPSAPLSNVLSRQQPLPASSSALHSTAAAEPGGVDATLLTTTAKLPDLSQAAFPDIPDEPYDLVVLGSGPAGETAAVRAARLGKTVAVVEIKKAFGGPTGLTSKAFREATKRIVKTVEQVGGDRNRQIRRLWKKRFPALKSEAEVFQAAETRERLTKTNCDLFIGSAMLVKDPFEEDPDVITVRVCRPTGCVELPARHVVIATGSRPHRPKELRPGVPIPFTSRVVIDATQMANLQDLPESLVVLGGGVIAIEYATVLSQLGVSTYLICKPSAFLPFLPEELKDAIKRDMVNHGVELIEDEVQRMEVGEDKLVRIELSGRIQLEVDMVLYSGGRDANSEKIGCENVGVKVAKYGRIQVDKDFRTDNPRIFAVGDVIGPPGLASYAQQSARLVCDMLFAPKDEEGSSSRKRGMEASMEDVVDDDFFMAPSTDMDSEVNPVALNRMEAPLTLWTIPEVSSVGTSEEQAAAHGMYHYSKGGKIVTGYAYFRELARGRLSGDLNGFLKVIARCESPRRHVTLGFHIVGEGANELIQLGSILVNSGTTLEELSNTPFAAVTLSCLYQMASDDALCNSPFNEQKHPSQSKPKAKPAVVG